LVDYKVLGFGSDVEYCDHFLRTLLKTNWTYSYFVEWKKAKENVRRCVQEISLLNSLSKVRPEIRRQELKSIFMKYPEIIRVIPSIIALREHTIPILEVGETAFHKVFDFSRRTLTDGEAEDLVHFCDKVGILSLFGEISDLYAYLLGVEVGLDSNARKNRSGKIFQQLVLLLLRKKLEGMNVVIRPEDQSVQIARSKRADFVIYCDGRPKIAIECSFYNTVGSKPIETANAYIDLQHEIRAKRGFSFIWITDGPAWERMSQTIRQSFKEIDFPMNYTIAGEKLGKVVSMLLRSC
jgi:type II restriction enzyme